MPVGFNEEKEEHELQEVESTKVGFGEDTKEPEMKPKKKKLQRGKSKALSFASSKSVRWKDVELTLDDVANAMQNKKTGFEMGNHKRFFKLYENSFEGRTAINWFIQNEYSPDIPTAVELGEEMADANLIIPLTSSTFIDTADLYRLSSQRTADKKTIEKYRKNRMELFGEITGSEGVKLKTRKYLFNSYESSFVGSEAIEWLVDHGYASGNEMAIDIGTLMMSDHFIQACADEDRSGKFKDDYALYTFIILSPRVEEALNKKTELAEAMQGKSGVSRKERKLGTKRFSDAFTGSGAVKWFKKNNWVNNISEAIELGNVLIREGVFDFVIPGAEDFDDNSDLIYRFSGVGTDSNLDPDQLNDYQTLFSILHLKDNTALFKQYTNTFVAKEAIDSLLNLRYANNRDDATKILNDLRKKGAFYHVEDKDKEFTDSASSFWVLRSKEQVDVEKRVHKFPGDKRKYNELLKKGQSAVVDKRLFGQLFDIRDDAFIDGILRIFGNEKVLNYEQFQTCTQVLFDTGDVSAKLKVIFQLLDPKETGSIKRADFDTHLSKSASANGFSSLSKEKIMHLADLVLKHLGIADPQDNEIDRDEIIDYTDIGSHRGKENIGLTYKKKATKFNFTKRNLNDDKKPAKKVKTDKSELLFDTSELKGHPDEFSSYWYLESVKIVWMTFWLIANLGLFAGGFVVYSVGSKRDEFLIIGWGLTLAKAFSYTIYMNASLILIFISRWYLTILQDYWIAHYLPLHKNVVFHRYTALAMMLASTSHALAHLWDVYVLTTVDIETVNGILNQGQFRRNPPYIVWVLGTIPGLTGIIIVISQLSILVTAVYKEWRRAHFDIFWYTHHLYIPFYICISIHGLGDLVAFPIYWCFLIFPAFTFSVERIRRLYRQVVGVKVYSAIHAERTGVLKIQFEKPAGLRYKAGMFVFINWRGQITQWHPFTLTSSPLEEHMSVAIKSLGDWTKALTLAFKDVEQSVEALSRAVPLAVDGPYGAPAEDFFEYKVVMLVGAGIGITPFASVVKDIYLRKKRVEKAIKKKTSSANTKESRFKASEDENTLHLLEKVYLFWLNPNAESFLWFAELLQDVEGYKGMFRNSTYITRATNQSDIRNWALNKGLDLDFDNTGVDAVTSLRARTLWGRPDWDRVFETMAGKFRGETIGVFFCGAPIISKDLRIMCEKYTNTESTKFQYAKENF
jgi:predicted ferric reductase